MPVLDATVRQLLAVLDDPESTTQAAVTLIEQDADFAAQLLRMANSAYYARRAVWRTVRQAFAALGRATRSGCSWNVRPTGSLSAHPGMAPLREASYTFTQ